MTVSALGKTGNLRGVREVMSWVEAPDTPGLGLEFADLVFTIGAADLDVPPNASHLELVRTRPSHERDRRSGRWSLPDPLRT